MNTTTRWTRLLTALTLTLCASSCATGYGSKGLFGGFTETQLDANTVRVNFQGNGFTSKEKVETYTMLRCAELTVQNGYDWFLVMNQDTEGQDTQVHSGSYNSSGTTGGASISEYGTVSTWSSTSGYTSPSSTFGIRKYNSALVIKMFTGEKPSDAMHGYDAHEVLTYLGAQVKRG